MGSGSGPGSATGAGSRSGLGPGSGSGTYSEPGGRFFALTRSWAAGGLAYIATGFLTSRLLFELLATETRLESFGWRLSLLHLPVLAASLLTVLAAARVLPDEHRESRALYLLATLTVPLAGMTYAFALSREAVGAEGVVMPLAALVTGAVSGVAVDRLLEDRATRPAPPPRNPYDWRDGGATATEYLGVAVLVITLIGAMAMTGTGGRIGERMPCAVSVLAGGGGSCTTGGGEAEETFATGVSDAREAATAAGAGSGPGSTRRATKDVRLRDPEMARDARRIDYAFTADGKENTPNAGTPMTGALVAGVDSGGVPFVVRLNAVKGEVSGAELDELAGVYRGEVGGG
ncbi:hypothetical protein [Streptomyces sp. cmx-18-6]|uniref:hypothetical protein n=1 Tax=Streptomyces sp. cmx-18-6 TaxID=2790930 RepID=UPI0039803295